MDDEGGAFFPNLEIDETAATRIRAPADEMPYDPDDDTSFCFASRFSPGDDDDPTDLGSSQLKDAFSQMHALIERHMNNNTSMTDLVDAVHGFYEVRVSISVTSDCVNQHLTTLSAPRTKFVRCTTTEPGLESRYTCTS